MPPRSTGRNYTTPLLLLLLLLLLLPSLSSWAIIASPIPPPLSFG